MHIHTYIQINVHTSIVVNCLNTSPAIPVLIRTSFIQKTLKFKSVVTFVQHRRIPTSRLDALPTLALHLGSLFELDHVRESCHRGQRRLRRPDARLVGQRGPDDLAAGGLTAVRTG